MSDLLLLACSKRKLHTAGLLPAFQRYDGGAFRVVKRAMREGYAPRTLAILILSAKYGLIPEKYRIEDYDQCMNIERACELREEVGHRLDDELGQQCPQSVFVSLGQLYHHAISTAIAFRRLEHDGIVQHATGRPGERQAQVRGWLWKRASTQDELPPSIRGMDR
jgi:hypothetical protein